MVRKSVLLFFTALMISGCQPGPENEPRTGGQETERRLEAANREIEEWKAHSEALSQKLGQANLRNENLRIHANEMEEWIRFVIKAIGPCVWAGGPFDRPEPREIVGNGSPNELMSKLNGVFRTSKLPEAILLRIEDGTAYVKIPDDERLTQGMGTSGAANYLNSITYTFWSVRDVECVAIDFEEGDHAFPVHSCVDEVSQSSESPQAISESI